MKILKKLKFSTKLFCVGACLTVISLVVLLIVGGANLIPFNKDIGRGNNYGILPGLWFYAQSFNIDYGWTGTGKGVWGTTDALQMFAVSIEFVLFGLALVAIIISILKKRYKNIGYALAFVLVTMYVSYLVISIITYARLNWMWRASYGAYIWVTVFAVLGLIFVAAPIVLDLKEAVYLVVGEKEEKEAEEKPVEEKKEEAPVAAGLTEAEVEKIVEEYLAKHVKSLHDEKKVEPAPAPVVEKVIIVKEEPKPEPEPEPAPAPVPEIATKGKAKRRVSFETKLKKSDYDLRHQYYDLRDYIRSYGVKNRISIPGDSFSAHRERLVFITISGKHLKVCYALHPSAYNESPIPVKVNDSKKFADVPCEFHVRSNLSFRRACKLVDDVMASKGIVKPEEKK